MNDVPQELTDAPSFNWISVANDGSMAGIDLSGTIVVDIVI